MSAGKQTEVPPQRRGGVRATEVRQGFNSARARWWQCTLLQVPHTRLWWLRTRYRQVLIASQVSNTWYNLHLYVMMKYIFIVYSILLNFIKSHFPSERACPIAAKMAKSLNSSRSHYSYNQYPYHNMETADYSSSLSCPCPMGICL